MPPIMAPIGAELRDGDGFPIPLGEVEEGEAGERVFVDSVDEEEVVVGVSSKL
jgi:hypothetical protein